MPRYYVFYNGLKYADDEVILKLTDSMAGANASEISSAEFTAHMININAGHSASIMQRCPLLHQYALFIAELRKHISDGLPLGEAIETTVVESINEGILADLLRGHRAEVTNMLFKEFDIDAHIASEKEISYEEGLIEGQRVEKENTEREKERADKFLDTTIHLYHKLGKTIDEIASLCDQSPEYIQSILNKPLS